MSAARLERLDRQLRELRAAAPLASQVRRRRAARHAVSGVMSFACGCRASQIVEWHRARAAPDGTPVAASSAPVPASWGAEPLAAAARWDAGAAAAEATALLRFLRSVDAGGALSFDGDEHLASFDGDARVAFAGAGCGAPVSARSAAEDAPRATVAPEADGCVPAAAASPPSRRAEARSEDPAASPPTALSTVGATAAPASPSGGGAKPSLREIMEAEARAHAGGGRTPVTQRKRGDEPSSAGSTGQRVRSVSSGGGGGGGGAVHVRSPALERSLGQWLAASPPPRPPALAAHAPPWAPAALAASPAAAVSPAPAPRAAASLREVMAAEVAAAAACAVAPAGAARSPPRGRRAGGVAQSVAGVSSPAVSVSPSRTGVAAVAGGGSPRPIAPLSLREIQARARRSFMCRGLLGSDAGMTIGRRHRSCVHFICSANGRGRRLRRLCMCQVCLAVCAWRVRVRL